MSEQYIVIILYSALLVMCSINAWKILYRQGKWRTVPLLVFYVISIIAVSFRLIATIYWFSVKHNFRVFFICMQPIAKGCVGLIQCWMVLELTIVLRRFNIIDNGGRVSIEDHKRQERCLNLGKWTTVGVIILIFSVCLVIVSIDTRRN